MIKFNLKKLFIYILGTLFIELLSSSFIFLKTDAKISNNVPKENVINKAKRKSVVETSLNLKPNKATLLNTFIEDLNNGDIIKLLALDINDKEGVFLNIESDSQSERDNVFFAEGNVVIYLSNGILKSDKVIFDSKKKEFIAEGNVIFSKGEQYFEASKLLYNTKTRLGYLNDIYGVVDAINFEKDLDLKIVNNQKSRFKNKEKSIRNLTYINNSKFGLVNEYSSGKSLDIKDIDIEIPTVSKWRFKAKKLIINQKKIQSKRIIFTNDAFNQPQFKLISKNFVAELIDDKVKLISNNTWINLDEKVNFPIGRWTIFDRNRISKWSIGSDFDEKDGFYISRAFDDINLSEDFTLQIEPFYLIQRSIKGNSNSFREPNSSIFSEKVKQNIKTSDNFALDINLIGKINSWDVDLNSSSNTLNIDRISESSRSKLTFTKYFNLEKKNQSEKNSNDEKLKVSNQVDNTLDLQFFSAYREKVSKGYSGDAEIYFANGFSLANRKSWEKNKKRTNLSFIYNLGQYNAKRKNQNRLESLIRNYFGVKIDNEIPLWEKEIIFNNISEDFKYTPKIIKPSVYWRSNINLASSLYSNGASQEAASFNTGPHFTFGDFKKNFFDYTNLSATYTYILKSGESPFEFDDLNKDSRLKLELSQQIYGPILFGFEAYIPLDLSHSDYGDFIDPKYKIEIQRRAYSLAAFYNKKDESVGLEFNIFNFDFSGSGKSF